MSEAMTMGIVNEVVEGDDFRQAVREYAEGFLPPTKASKAVGLIKRSVCSGIEMSLEEGLSLERELQQQLFGSEDAKEGLAAYVEKRRPEFGGR